MKGKAEHMVAAVYSVYIRIFALVMSIPLIIMWIACDLPTPP